MRHLGQLHAVAGEREIDIEGGEHGDQSWQMGAQRRLPTGDADRLEPEALDTHAGDPGLLLVGEELFAG